MFLFFQQHSLFLSFLAKYKYREGKSQHNKDENIAFDRRKRLNKVTQIE